MGTTSSYTNQSDVPPNQPRVVQNFSLVWVDATVYKFTKDAQNTIEQLRSVVNDVNLFDQPDECVDFLKALKSEKAFVISSGSFGQTLVPRIHSIESLDAIFIFCNNQAWHEQWAKEWSKIKGVHTNIKPIFEALQLAVQQCNQNITPISFVQSSDEGFQNIDLNRLESSFMYTQIFKNILLDMKHEDNERQTLVKFCRNYFSKNSKELKVIAEFSRDYESTNAVRWYTRECFTYQMLNRALRLLEGDIIVDMGFFIADLHRQLEQLHKAQVGEYGCQPFVVFRGQGLALDDYQKLRKNQNGLMAFNSFVSTSKVKKASKKFAERAVKNPEMVGVLFVMTIDPKENSTPFADITDISYFRNEAEVLFSMHSVFRIGKIRSMDKGGRLFEVQLTLTSEGDPQLRTLTALIEKEVSGTDWHRIGRLLINLGQVNKAEELYRMLFDRSSNERDRGACNHQLGLIKDKQGKYAEALEYYRRAIDYLSKMSYCE